MGRRFDRAALHEEDAGRQRKSDSAGVRDEDNADELIATAEAHPASVLSRVLLGLQNETRVRPDDILSLQGSVGNRNVQRLLAKRVEPRAPAARRHVGAAPVTSDGFERRDENGVAADAQALVDRAAALSGQPLPEDVRTRFERSLDADLSHVRIHTGGESAEAAKAVGARAYALGQDIHFAAGQYPATDSLGSELLAHEVVHTVQQQGSTPVRQLRLEVSTPNDTAEVEADRAAAALVAGQPSVVSRTPLIVSRDPNPATAKPGDKGAGATSSEDERKKRLQDALDAAGVTLADQDFDTLHTRFKFHTLKLAPIQVVLSKSTNTAAAAARVPCFQVTGEGSGGSMAIYAFQVEHGRSILVVGQDGASRLLDAGGAAGAAMGGLQNVVAAGLAKYPGAVKLSHADEDHMTDLAKVLNATGVPKPVLEVTRQQIETQARAFQWSRVNLSGEKVCEINVSGTMHVHVEISGGLQYTDIRWGPAATGTNKNATSPMTVVRDHTKGTTALFTADGEPSTIMKMLDYVHPSALKYVLGQQLAVAELPHHGGASSETRKLQAGINYVRMLRVMYEASDGNTTFFVQAKAADAEHKTNHVRALHEAGFPVEQVLYDYGVPPDQQNVKQPGGGGTQTLTPGAGELKPIEDAAKAEENPLMTARKTGAKVQQLLDLLEAQRAAASAGDMKEVVTAIDRTIAEVKQADSKRAEAVNKWFNELQTAVVNARGVDNTKLDLSGCKAAMEELTKAPTVDAEKFAEFERAAQMNESMLTAAGRTTRLAVQMCEALLMRQHDQMAALKAQQGQAYREAVSLLGSAKVKAEIKGAWEAEAKNLQVMQGKLLELGLQAARQQVDARMTARALGAVSSAMQMEEIVNRASHGGGGIPRTSSGAVSTGARAGAGAMAVFEIIRITLEVLASVKSGMDAADLRKQASAARGRNLVVWWQRWGANPSVELVDSDGARLEPPLSDPGRIEKALAGELDEYKDLKDPRLVVTNVSDADQMQVAMALTLGANDLNDWHRLLNDARRTVDDRNRPPIRVADDGKKWETMMWNHGTKDYVGRANAAVTTQLEAAYVQCHKTTQAKIDQRVEKGDVKTGSVKDTGFLWRTAYQGYVYQTRYGGLKPVKFPFRPKFVIPKEKSTWDLIQVSAADADTYDYLRQFLWPTRNAEATGDQANVQVNEPNERGLCMIKQDDTAPY